MSIMGFEQWNNTQGLAKNGALDRAIVLLFSLTHRELTLVL